LCPPCGSLREEIPQALCPGLADVELSTDRSDRRNTIRQEPTSAIAGHAATAAPTAPCPGPWATFAASVPAIPRPSSKHS
jgi:hypothetical protein